jgi:hypothetical protein
MKTSKLASTFALTILVAGMAFVSAKAEAQALQYFAVSPCRVYDTRTGAPSAGGTGGGVINSATVRSFLLRGLCGIPQAAAAVSLNLTITQPTAPAGDLRIAPTGGSFPNVSTINYVQNDTIANGAIVPLGSVSVGQPDFQVLGAGCAGANCSSAYTYQLIIDVTGYFQ